MIKMYSKKTMEHFLHPKFHKKIKKVNGVGQVGNVICGDIMKLFINVENNVIKDIAVETMGCVAAIASSDILCEMVKGKTIDEALKIKSFDIVKKMGQVPKIKIHCSVLAAEALKKAIEDYKKKKK